MSRHDWSRALDGIWLQFSFLNLDASRTQQAWANQDCSQEANKIVASREFCHVAFLEPADSVRSEHRWWESGNCRDQNQPRRE